MKYYAYNMHKNRILKNWKVADEDGNEICTIDANHPEPVTIAHLLAYAPALLAALKGAQSALRKALPQLNDEATHYCGEWLDEINETIKKAEA